MKKATQKKLRPSTYGTAVAKKLPGPVGYNPKEHPMTRMKGELAKKRKLDPPRKGTSKAKGPK